MRPLLVIVALAVSACGKAGVGETCSQTSDCATGTSCILNGGMSTVGGMLKCDDTAKLCSVTCTGDGDCASLGTGYICIHECFMGSCLMGHH